MRKQWLSAAALLWSVVCWSEPGAAPGQVVVSGAVPDEATRVAILARLRSVYGQERVVDQIKVGGVVTPPEWSASVQKLITSELKAISPGELRIDGTQITVRGEASNEATRQDVVSRMATALNSRYSIRNALRVAAADQHVLDQALNNRIVEFEIGSAVLTEAGRLVLNDMIGVLRKLPNRRVEITGHTDNMGSREGNLVLSQARADAVKNYLRASGLAAEYLSTSGVGADRPLADNDTPEGRARNRRIEFRLGQ